MKMCLIVLIGLPLHSLLKLELRIFGEMQAKESLLVKDRTSACGKWMANDFI